MIVYISKIYFTYIIKSLSDLFVAIVSTDSAVYVVTLPVLEEEDNIF